MKNVFVSLVLVLFASSVFGQNRLTSYVYFKNGNILKGLVVHNDLQSLKLLSGKNLLVFDKNEIDSVSGSRIRYKQNIPVHTNYFFTSSGTVIAGDSGNDKDAPFAFSASFDYRVIDKFYAGAGLGVEFWNESYMPVFCDLQYFFRSSVFTPFLNLQTGYLIPLGEPDETVSYYLDDYWQSADLDANGGFFINPAFGFRSMINNNFGWSFSFGYRFHRFNYSDGQDYSRENNFNRLTLRLGLIFN